MVDTCPCGNKMVPIVSEEISYLGKKIKNVPAFRCTDPNCKYKISYSSEVLERVEDLINMGLYDYKVWENSSRLPCKN